MRKIKKKKEEIRKRKWGRAIGEEQSKVKV